MPWNLLTAAPAIVTAIVLAAAQAYMEYRPAPVECETDMECRAFCQADDDECDGDPEPELRRRYDEDDELADNDAPYCAPTGECQ